jgi:hypothetical protein
MAGASTNSKAGMTVSWTFRITDATNSNFEVWNNGHDSLRGHAATYAGTEE